jgi:hypothetical protein
VFVSALGAMAYAEVDLEGMLRDEWERLEWGLEAEEWREGGEADEGHVEGARGELEKRRVAGEVARLKDRTRALDLRSIQCE